MNIILINFIFYPNTQTVNPVNPIVPIPISLFLCAARKGSAASSHSEAAGGRGADEGRRRRPVLRRQRTRRRHPRHAKVITQKNKNMSSPKTNPETLLGWQPFFLFPYFHTKHVLFPWILQEVPLQPKVQLLNFSLLVHKHFQNCSNHFVQSRRATTHFLPLSSNMHYYPESLLNHGTDDYGTSLYLSTPNSLSSIDKLILYSEHKIFLWSQISNVHA
ncbi:hypothetical protein Taro_053454 [Colocasia esculenta]|uniref:Uncharacterized protein n=1 Tax=Colocasia esculenta TaxID=4460 RepID=A0A843XMM0_COLES|nr:hypothetical protein [Colocasia esculenta]